MSHSAFTSCAVSTTANVDSYQQQENECSSLTSEKRRDNVLANSQKSRQRLSRTESRTNGELMEELQDKTGRSEGPSNWKQSFTSCFLPALLHSDSFLPVSSLLISSLCVLSLFPPSYLFLSSLPCFLPLSLYVFSSVSPPLYLSSSSTLPCPPAPLAPSQACSSRLSSEMMSPAVRW